MNEQPIFIRGGNWILSDGLLRLSDKRYKTDIKFHSDMNFNMIRCWGGGIAERPEFYHYCDIYGLLVRSHGLRGSLCTCCVCIVYSSYTVAILKSVSHSMLAYMVLMFGPKFKSEDRDMFYICHDTCLF